MMQVWAVARQMIAEGVRMKIALVFLVLIGLLVVGLPLSIEGDASLTGAVQSFLSYGMTGTAVLLGILTVFLSRSLSDELVQKHVFFVMTKPVPRWQFILGKWLGMTLLNAVFLTFAVLVIYGMVHRIKRTHRPLDERVVPAEPVKGDSSEATLAGAEKTLSFDRSELENEVLVARHGIKPILPDFEKPAELEFQRNLEEGLYANVPNFNAEQERHRLRLKQEARWRVVGPLDTRVFDFENVLCDRSPGQEIQIRYKTDVSQFPSDEVFRAWWRIGDASKGTPVYRVPVRHVVGRRHIVRVPADAVANDNTLFVQFFNENPFEGERQAGNVIEFRKSDEVEVLFPVGSFEGNLFRASILLLCKLMFLGAVALLAASVFSFPVACLLAFTVYVLAGTRSFLADALDMASDDTMTMFSSVKEFAVHLIMYTYKALCWLIPDFGYYDPVETIVNGRNVPLVWVLQATGDLLLVKTAIALGIAMLLFQRREVAEVSI